MYKLALAALFASTLSTAASAATVDAFSLDVTSAAGTDSSIALDLGTTYTVTISGTFSLGRNETRHIADAEFFNLGTDPIAPLDATSSLEFGVGIDGADVDFGPFNAANIYSTTVVGDGGSINVFLQDSNYDDNTGSLRVEISVVPLPAGLALLLTGIAGLGIARRRAV